MVSGSANLSGFGSPVESTGVQTPDLNGGPIGRLAFLGWTPPVRSAAECLGIPVCYIRVENSRSERLQNLQSKRGPSTTSRARRSRRKGKTERDPAQDEAKGNGRRTAACYNCFAMARVWS